MQIESITVSTYFSRSNHVAKLTPQQREDKYLIEHPELWPRKIVLPLRRRREFEYEDDIPELGFIIYNQDYPLSIVFQDSIMVFDELLEADKKGTRKTGLRDLTRTVYRSVTRMLLNGWEVDRE